MKTQDSRAFQRFFGTCYQNLAATVGATSKSTELQITQQAKPIFQDAIRVAAKPAYADSFTKNIAREAFTGINAASLRLQIAQSPDKPQNTNSAPNEAEAKIKPLWDKAFQLMNQALQLAKQPSAAAVQQAITKYEEALKIFSLPEVRSAYEWSAFTMQGEWR
ncbi:MAG: hypothetical protein RMY34_03670 [Aulosira sp. DedQUE10]|nr:hypothetical protein [Aulosira sp. DedQUE10]